MTIEESGLRFDFAPSYQVIKFDETNFYRQYFNKLPGSKGIDMMALSSSVVLMIEVKNFTGYEMDNTWRTVSNKLRDGEESLDIEVAKKVAMSLACLFGASTKKEKSSNAASLDPYFESLAGKVGRQEAKLQVVLFVEGVTDSHARTKKMKMKALTDSIKRQLSWLACDVLVEDTALHKAAYFGVTK